jgi:hypothetical protein
VKRANHSAECGDTQFYEDLINWRTWEDDIEFYEWESIGADEDVDESCADDMFAESSRTWRIEGLKTE